jgi:hypothetical protein
MNRKLPHQNQKKAKRTNLDLPGQIGSFSPGRRLGGGAGRIRRAGEMAAAGGGDHPGGEGHESRRNWCGGTEGIEEWRSSRGGVVWNERERRRENFIFYFTFIFRCGPAAACVLYTREDGCFVKRPSHFLSCGSTVLGVTKTIFSLVAARKMPPGSLFNGLSFFSQERNAWWRLWKLKYPPSMIMFETYR